MLQDCEYHMFANKFGFRFREQLTRSFGKRHGFKGNGGSLLFYFKSNMRFVFVPAPAVMR